MRDFPRCSNNRLFSPGRRRGRRQRADARPLRAAGLPRLRDFGREGTRPAGWRGWPQARAAPHPLRDERDGAGCRSATGQVGARRRRRARPLPPARRPGRVRRDGADGAGLLAALPVDRRAGQLRQPRRRRCGGDALHRGAPDADRSAAARRDRRGHCRLHAELRRLHAGAAPAARAAALRAAQRRLGHRRRDGHRDPVAQPARSRGRHAAPDEGSEDVAGGRAAGDARPGLPGRRPAHLLGAGDPRRLCLGTRQPQGPRASRVRGTRARAVAARRHRAAAGRVVAARPRGDRGADQPEGQGRQEGAQRGTGPDEAARAVRAGRGARRIRQGRGGAPGVRAAHREGRSRGTGARAAVAHQHGVERPGQPRDDRPRRAPALQAADRGAAGVDRVPGRHRATALAAPAPEGAGPDSHPRGPAGDPAEHRQGHQADPQLGRAEAGPDEGLQAVRAAGRGHPRDPPAPAGSPRGHPHRAGTRGAAQGRVDARQAARLGRRAAQAGRARRSRTTRGSTATRTGAAR